MLEQILKINDFTSKARVETVCNCLKLEWNNMNGEKKYQILQALAKNERIIPEIEYRSVICHILGKSETEQEFLNVFDICPQIFNQFDGATILNYLNRFRLAKLLLFLDPEDNDVLSWVEHNILILDLNGLDPTKLSRFWNRAILTILEKGNIIFFYNSLKHSILGPLIVHNIPEASLNTLLKFSLPNNLFSVFKSLLVDSANQVQMYFNLSDSESSSLKFLVGICTDSQIGNVSDFIENALFLGQKHQDNIYVNILKKKLKASLAADPFVKLNKAVMFKVVLLSNNDPSLKILAIMHSSDKCAIQIMKKLLEDRYLPLI